MKQLTLKAARQRKGWTQEELETRSGITQATISKIESGLITNPSHDTIVSLELALGLKRGALLGQAEEARAS